MLLIMLGAIICVVLFAVGLWAAGVVCAVLIVLALFLPTEGFKESELVQETDLIKLKRSNFGNNCYYVQRKNKKATYAFDNRDKYDLEGVAYEEASVKGKIKIYESQDCKRPVIKAYVIEPNREFITFAPFSTRVEYVFYVPEGSVIEQNKKGSKQPTTIV